MGRTKDESIRKIQKLKDTYYISIPIKEMRKLGWKEKQKVVVKRKGKELSIKDWPVVIKVKAGKNK